VGYFPLRARGYGVVLHLAPRLFFVIKSTPHGSSRLVNRRAHQSCGPLASIACTAQRALLVHEQLLVSILLAALFELIPLI